MKDRKKNRSEERGFTLIEVMISIVILTVGLLTLAQMMVIATHANALSGRMTASAALAKEQLELLKAAPFYLDPTNISLAQINPLLKPGGDIDSNVTGYFQHYDSDGQPVASENQALFLVRWKVDLEVPPNGPLPLSMLRITVRCQGTGQAYAYQVVGDATFTTLRTANVG